MYSGNAEYFEFKKSSKGFSLILVNQYLRRTSVWKTRLSGDCPFNGQLCFKFIARHKLGQSYQMTNEIDLVEVPTAPSLRISGRFSERSIRLGYEYPLKDENDVEIGEMFVVQELYSYREAVENIDKEKG